MADLVAGNTGATLQVQCTQDGAAMDLTGFSATLKWRITGGSTVVTRNMAVTNAASGLCEYTFAADELTPGTMYFEVVLTDQTNKTITQKEQSTLKIRSAL